MSDLLEVCTGGSALLCAITMLSVFRLFRNAFVVFIGFMLHVACASFLVCAGVCALCICSVSRRPAPGSALGFAFVTVLHFCQCFLIWVFLYASLMLSFYISYVCPIVCCMSLNFQYMVMMQSKKETCRKHIGIYKTCIEIYRKHTEHSGQCKKISKTRASHPSALARLMSDADSSQQAPPGNAYSGTHKRHHGTYSRRQFFSPNRAPKRNT